MGIVQSDRASARQPPEVNRKPKTVSVTVTQSLLVLVVLLAADESNQASGLSELIFGFDKPLSNSARILINNDESTPTNQTKRT